MKKESGWINPVSDWSTDPEEVANTVTHGLGFLLSIVGAVVMTVQVLREGDTWRVFGCLVYAPSLVAVYAMSTLSHVCADRHLRQWYRRLDQGFIYILIVATYTPFSFAFLRTVPWSLFVGLMWCIAIFGFISKVLLSHRIDGVAVWIYVALGWMPIAAAPALSRYVPANGLLWMLIGGLFYTSGTVFLMFDHRGRHLHAVWHLFVIAGSTCHYFVILLFVAPVP